MVIFRTKFSSAMKQGRCVSKQNCHIWDSENHQIIEERLLYPEKVTVGTLYGPKV